MANPKAIILSSGLLASLSGILAIVQMTSAFNDSLESVQDLPQAEGPVTFNFTASVPQATLDAMLAAAKTDPAAASTDAAAASGSSRLLKALNGMTADSREAVLSALEVSAGRFRAKKARALADAAPAAGADAGAGAAASSESSDASASGSGVAAQSSDDSSSGAASGNVNVAIGGEKYVNIAANGIAARFNLTITVGDSEGVMDKSQSSDFKYIPFGAKPGLDADRKDEDGNAVDNGPGCPLAEDILTADELKALEEASDEDKTEDAAVASASASGAAAASSDSSSSSQSSSSSDDGNAVAGQSAAASAGADAGAAASSSSLRALKGDDKEHVHKRERKDGDSGKDAKKGHKRHSYMNQINNAVGIPENKKQQLRQFHYCKVCKDHAPVVQSLSMIGFFGICGSVAILVLRLFGEMFPVCKCGDQVLRFGGAFLLFASGMLLLGSFLAMTVKSGCLHAIRRSTALQMETLGEGYEQPLGQVGAADSKLAGLAGMGVPKHSDAAGAEKEAAVANADGTMPFVWEADAKPAAALWCALSGAILAMIAGVVSAAAKGTRKPSQQRTAAEAGVQ